MLLLFLLAAAGSIQAQTSGTLFFGANVLSATAKHSADQPAQQLSLQSKIGYFATNRLAIGLSLETGMNGNKTVPYGITLFSRWYAGKQPHQTVKFYVEAGAGIADHPGLNRETMMMRADQNWMRAAAYVSPGINVFPVQWMALELAPEYRYISGSNAMHRFGISAGIKIFLSEEVFKGTFPNKFNSLY